MAKRSEWADAHEDSLEADALRAQLVDLQARVAFYESLKTTPRGREIPPHKSTGGNAIPIVLASDWHVEERVDAADVPGAYNLYNPAIARKRSEQFAQKTVLLTNVQRGMCKITEMVLFLGGDFITGHLHDDNRESNWMSPVKAILLAMDLLNGVIKHLLDHGNFERITLPCCFGNHSRLTHKPRAKTAPDTSLEWMMYNLLATHWKHEKRLVFHIADAVQLYLPVFEYPIRFMHGDDVSYGGGVGGITIPMRRAIADWDKTKRAYCSMFGHFHTAVDIGNAIGNGSLIGANAYGVRIHAAYEPPRQQFVLIDQKRGKSSVSHIYTDYLPPITKE